MKWGGERREREGINCKGKQNKTAKDLEGGKKQDMFKELRRRPAWPEYGGGGGGAGGGETPAEARAADKRQGLGTITKI